MASHRSLLLISYYFPPVKVVGAVRIFHFYRNSLRYFRQIIVLASANRNRMEQDPGLILEGVDLHELPAWDLRRLSLRRASGNRPYAGSGIKKRVAFRFISRLADSFPFSLLLADGGFLYIVSGVVKGSRLVKQRNVTHIFSSFRPYADHFIAFGLKKRFPHLVWIADFRDAPVDPNRRNVFWPRFQHWCNRRVLRRADVVTTVSKGLADHLSRYHHRVYVLRNGVERFSGDLPSLSLPSAFLIAYTGSLYPELQDPSPFLEALARLMAEGKIRQEEIRLIVAGKDEALWEEQITGLNLSSVFFHLGVISRNQSLALQRQSHLNLLLTWSGPQLQGILSAKLYEYLDAGRPVLALVNGPRDEELEAILYEKNPGNVFYGSRDAVPHISDFLYRHFLQWKNETLGLPVPASFYWEELMEEFMQQLGSSGGK